MRFVDLANITVNAGNGGRGCSAFAQPPYTRFPYPDGGDGGDGGDVIVRADPNVATLLDFQFRHEFKAGRGGHGGANTKTGKRGEDCVIRVPVGTVIREASDGRTLRDLTEAGDEVIIAHGGRGGYGNATRAASAKQLEKTQHRALAAEATPGEAGERFDLILELKLIADVGIVGFPNAGKSSLLRRLSTARPKVGAYPFTTRYPVLGVVQVDGRGSFVACDIPGLIEGAHQGKGLGFEFLRHIERTRVLIHLVDLAGVDGRDPVEAYYRLNGELSQYHESLMQKPQVIAANKLDLPEARQQLERFSRAVGRGVVPISCATGEGIPALIEAVWETLHRHE
jgi:GTP-binding protein